MGTRTSYEAGTFSWVELATTDPDDAKRFYGGLFGWDFEDEARLEGDGSAIARLDGEAVAGITEPPASQGTRAVPPSWVSYVTVASADESATRAGELGGTVHAEPFDIGRCGAGGGRRRPDRSGDRTLGGSELDRRGARERPRMSDLQRTRDRRR